MTLGSFLAFPFRVGYCLVLGLFGLVFVLFLIVAMLFDQAADLLEGK